MMATGEECCGFRRAGTLVDVRKTAGNLRLRQGLRRVTDEPIEESKAHSERMFVLKKHNNKQAGSTALKKGLMLGAYFVTLRALYYASTQFLQN